jgi:hypothetical protein
MKKFILDVDNCIILNDVKTIRQEKQDKKVKTKRQLAKRIVKEKLLPGVTDSSIYTKIYRLEKDGFDEKPVEIIEAILKILDVDEVDLVKEVK